MVWYLHATFRRVAWWTASSSDAKQRLPAQLPPSSKQTARVGNRPFPTSLMIRAVCRHRPGRNASSQMLAQRWGILHPTQALSSRIYNTSLGHAASIVTEACTIGETPRGLRHNLSPENYARTLVRRDSKSVALRIFRELLSHGCSPAASVYEIYQSPTWPCTRTLWWSEHEWRDGPRRRSLSVGGIGEIGEIGEEGSLIKETRDRLGVASV